MSAMTPSAPSQRDTLSYNLFTARRDDPACVRAAAIVQKDGSIRTVKFTDQMTLLNDDMERDYLNRGDVVAWPHQIVHFTTDTRRIDGNYKLLRTDELDLSGFDADTRRRILIAYHTATVPTKEDRRKLNFRAIAPANDITVAKEILRKNAELLAAHPPRRPKPRPAAPAAAFERT